MNVDFIIVGQGIAGTCFAFELLKQNKTFVIVDKYDSHTSSRIALGVYNPLVLKWFTKAWNVDEQIDYFYNFYDKINTFLNQEIYYDIGIYKFLKTPYTQNHWLTKSISSNRLKYMSSELHTIENKSLRNSKFYGIVKSSGRVNIVKLLELFRKHCKKNNILIEDTFDYKNIILKQDSVIFKDVHAKKIIFCEGKSVLNNPYFNKLNLQPTKGEVLTISCKDINLNKIIHSGGLLVPLGNNYYSVGSTYNGTDINNSLCTIEGKQELISILNKILICPYKIIHHQASLRPSTSDRRALIGVHPYHKNMYILNGLGTRGVLLAPYLSKILCDNIYSNTIIKKEVSINRL